MARASRSGPTSPFRGSAAWRRRVRSMQRSVAAIATTPVKGFALSFPERVTLGVDGVEENRRFALLDERGERLRSSKHAWPCTVAADYDTETERLRRRLPDGRTVVGAVATAAPVTFDYHGPLVGARAVD